ncbi:hypothetical protein ILYODFUR_022749 [Ilyodon furcidens]|uniref:Uncharacterized protein n=1 Tax=Ilyodon furcidens TaxID=33524 RepID=A0ABV0TAC3_9TELE
MHCDVRPQHDSPWEQEEIGSIDVTAVSWIFFQFVTWFPADPKYSREPIQTNSSWQHSGSSPEKSCNEPCSPSSVLVTPSAHTSDILTSGKSYANSCQLGPCISFQKILTLLVVVLLTQSRCSWFRIPANIILLLQ